MNASSFTSDHLTVPVISLSPMTLSAPYRGDDLQIRVSAPVTGSELPVVVFAHGFGNSMDGYAPLVNFWAAHGFVVMQPTFLDSRRHNLGGDDPRKPDIWRIRIRDVKTMLDELDHIEASFPAIKGRVDKSRIAAVGHSFGAQTAAMLLGARMMGAGGAANEHFSDKRITAGILLAAGGSGGDDLSDFAKAHLPYLNMSYAELTVPTLVVAGDRDYSPLTVRGPDWFTDVYYLSPGANELVTLFGGEHMLGGISGYLVTETTDENPERVAAVRRLTWAYLRRAFYGEDAAWQNACAALTAGLHPQGKVDSK